jgi:hypothetical protein
MSKEFVNISFDADSKVLRNQEDTGTFEGECTLTLVGREYKERNFNSVVPRGMIAYPESDKEYLKGLAECCVNLLSDIMNRMDKTTIEYNGRKTGDGMDVEYTHLVRMISNLMQWIVNSHSWREADFTNFDSKEIEMKLDYLQGMCKYFKSK